MSTPNLIEPEGTAIGKQRIDSGEWARRDTSTALPDVFAHFLLTQSSDHTRRNYTLDIRDFLDFCHQLGAIPAYISEVTEKLILLWREDLEHRHVRHQGARRRVVQTSVARKLSALSSLLDFAVKRKLIETNPARLIRRPRVTRESRTNALTSDEVVALLNQLDEDVTAASGDPHSLNYRSARLRQAVLYTLLSVGMRVDELCELRIADFEKTSAFARLHMTAKGNQEHAPIIHTRTAQILDEYIGEFRTQSCGEDHLFMRAQQVKKTTKLTQPAVYTMLNETARRAGIDKRLSPHSCRATLATLLHNAGVPIGQIQDLLNHKQITTTAIYIKKAQEISESAATKIDITNLAR